MNQQLTHSEIHRNNIRKEIILIAEELERPANVGGLIRTSESLGVEKIIFISPEITALSNKMKRVSRAAEKHIQVLFKTDVIAILQHYQKQGYRTVALELTSKSIPLPTYKIDSDKLILICGNEKTGVSQEVLQMVQDTINIPVYGTTSSLNVVVATGIALNHLNTM
ncbi:MAG: TrmH family RNA methyltransferase [Weeksellaceae bacterium]